MIISIVGLKGGAGKSTASITLASELHRRGHKTLLVDADPQGTARTWAATAADAGHDAPITVAMGKNLHRDLPRVAEPYEVTIVDCPPSDGMIARGALMSADLAVLPCRATSNDAWALARSIELAQEAQQIRPTLKARVLLSQLDSRTALGSQAREVFDSCGLPLLSTSLGYRVAYPEAMGLGQDVASYAPKTAAAKEAAAFTDEIISIASEVSNAA